MPKNLGLTIVFVDESDKLAPKLSEI